MTTKKIKNLIAKIWWCNIWNWHNWTSQAEQTSGSELIVSELPENLTPEQHKKIFIDSLKMYCKRCNKESPLSKKWRAKLTQEL